MISVECLQYRREWVYFGELGETFHFVILLPAGDAVLSGWSTLSLLTATLQQLSRVFELYLGPWGPGQTGFVALPSHPADSPIILQLQFLFDVLQKTLSLKVLGGTWGQGHTESPRE